MPNEPADKKPGAKPHPANRESGPDAGTGPHAAGTGPHIAGTGPHAAGTEPGDTEATPAADALTRERDEYLDNWKRERASFVNYKRWVEKERRNWEAAAACRLVEKLLPFIDDVDRALLASTEATDVESVRDGFRLIAGSFQAALARAGVEEIPADGEAFDPRVHEAVFQVEDPDRPNGTVTETTERGFRLGERLIRASKVVVSRAPDPAPSDEQPSDEQPTSEPPDPDADAARDGNEEG